MVGVGALTLALSPRRGNNPFLPFSLRENTDDVLTLILDTLAAVSVSQA
jgi:hypothetical protein